MSTTDLFASNIQNLTDLWKAMGAVSRAPGGGPVLHISESWPHRLWFDVEARPRQEDAIRLIDAARSASRPLIIPVWCSDEPDRSEQTLPACELGTAGFEVLFEQTVMALDLAGWRSDATGGADVELRLVEGETRTWAEIASRSFGYEVEEHVTDRIVQSPGVSMWTAFHLGRPVGTGLIYAEGEIAGLHMVGVPPEARRMGIARKIMLHLLDDARRRGHRTATLQASAMGEGLYRELGFASQGLVRNYRLSEKPRES